MRGVRDGGLEEEKNGIGPKSSTNRADGRSGTDKRGKVSLGRDVVHGARLTKIAGRLRLLGMYGLMYGDHEVPTCGRGFTCWDRKKKKKGLALKIEEWIDLGVIVCESEVSNSARVYSPGALRKGNLL